MVVGDWPRGTGMVDDVSMMWSYSGHVADSFDISVWSCGENPCDTCNCKGDDMWR